jgi:hypothetical protein
MEDIDNQLFQFREKWNQKNMEEFTPIEPVTLDKVNNKYKIQVKSSTTTDQIELYCDEKYICTILLDSSK